MSCERKDVLELLEAAGVKKAVADLDPALPLAAQGVDSLDMMNVLFGIEERFGVAVDEAALKAHDWKTVDAIAKSVNALLAVKS